jgi:predicted metal-dependent hydrolase
MSTVLELSNIEISVVRKDIKNVHLSVLPPDGEVRLSAPRRVRLETLRAYAIARLSWIRKQQKRLREQPRETPREHVERETHYVWGERCLLRVEETSGKTGIRKRPGKLIMTVRPGTPAEKRAELLARWYRDEIRAALPALLSRLEPRLGVTVNKVFIQRMKTKWGSCSPARGNVRLNTELAKKPPECLEYVLLHEMCHLIEPTHSDRFRELLTHAMPGWRDIRNELNRLPLG